METIHFLGKAVFNKISWQEYCAYLKQHNHFLDQRSYTKPYTNFLSEYQSTIVAPQFEFYGITQNGTIKGVTGIQEFEHALLPSHSIRYRVLRIDADQQGNNLGRRLLDFAVQHWPTKQYLFGYVRLSHVGWASHQGFKKIEKLISDSDHCFMGKHI